MVTLTRTARQLQEEIKNLKSKLADQHTKRTDVNQKKDTNWWSAPY